MRIAVSALLMFTLLDSCNRCTNRTPQPVPPSMEGPLRVDMTVANNVMTPENTAVHVFPEHDYSPNARDPLGVPFSAPAAQPAAGESLRTANLPLVYHGGLLMLHAHVVNVLWGNWSGAMDVVNRVVAFEQLLGRSGEYEVITQYGDNNGHKISLTDLTPSNVSFPGGATGIVTNQQIVASLRDLISRKLLPAPTPDTLYVVLLAPGIASKTSNVWSSCNSGLPGKHYCGYHSHFPNGSSSGKFAVIVYPSCRGCQGHPIPGISGPAAGITPIVEHEIREAATDKFFDAWYNSKGEADDLCNWSTFVDGGYQHQREWSNAVMKCVAKGINGP